MTNEEMAANISKARKELEEARGDLDAAERALPRPDADTTMATPALMAVLQRVRVARHRLTHLENILTADAGLPAEAGLPPGTSEIIQKS
jgi:hypothetical protein